MGTFLLRLITGIALALIVGPILVVLVVAFSSGASLSFPPPGVSLRWFVAFLQNNEMRNAFVLSIGLALVSASASTVLGLLAAVHVSRTRGTASNIVQILTMAPLVFPALILGVALLLMFKSLGIGILPGLFIAHVVVCLPYAFRSVLTSLQSFDLTLEEAGRSLGASPMRTFMLITLRIVWPGVLSGWLFAFVVSFGELNTALFLTGPGVTTLPIEIFSYLQFQGNQLVVAAASALQILVIILVLLVAERIVGARQIVQR
ncbi:ABC transporter permease [Aureimonas altamirensis]|jgi:putative spermidine/putrescine transport system permease protein|uniref:ABC transporter permease n=1 Tax=Aureimonas TaxID=414371 RepID=UPI00177ADBC2|nr:MULTISPECIES: ABC transporter permease [Aureimonas]MCM2504261.1 ABC transporter permease [Aureimonas altamirensis]QOG05177.1 ABC transporter permease [Aureimonas sp. OT7]